MRTRIVTDTTADIPSDLVARYALTVVPVYINVGDRSYLDDVELSRETFYEKLPHYEHHPTTSAPSLGTFVEAYEALAAEGAQEILSIHIASSLSGVQNVAHAASQAIQSARVTVFDSRQLTMGTGFLVLAAARAAEAGRSVAQILDVLQGMIHRVYSYAAPDTLEYLRRGGRLNRVQSSVGELLRIRPLLQMYQGDLTMERIRTSRRLLARMEEIVQNLAPLENLALVHANAKERAEGLWDRLSHHLPGADAPLITEVTPAIGAHVGPGALGLVCVEAGE